ncbi:FAD-dependent oxidoreductase [Streptomyces sp. NPDC000151]|uniref:NAD(P)/FAD-dependent oxidoreductase n=1 Tax=Streptomyces sp. NPDC000151 TaxID=3154244 RepID=UPI0033300BBC
MPDILIVGGGFAGMWAAAGAARLLRAHDASPTVALLTPDPDLTIRPRLYEADPAAYRVPLDRVLGPIGVPRIAATATGIDTARRVVTADGPEGPAELPYRRLVLATGSALVRPRFPGAGLLHDIDTMDAAVALEKHLQGLPDAPAGPGRFTAVVAGAGFTGVEATTELVGRLRAIAAPHGLADEVEVVLVERDTVVGRGLGEAARPVIERALDELGVVRRLGVSIERVDERAVHLSDGSALPSRTAVWTAGVRASGLTAQLPAERDGLGRLAVDGWLRVRGLPEVYAAGDTAAAPAEDGHTVTQSCQHATPQGKFAGHNAAADLLGLDRAPFATDPYVTCLDLGGAGAVLTSGWDRALREVPVAYAKARKRAINETWIHPPVDDAEEILRRADFRVGQRRPMPEPTG